MPDQAPAELPRIVLVFGDEAAVAHVREAMSGQADIVYAASAGNFDAARMDGACAALVNLDDGDWLDSIETKLNQAGVAVVFNDPEISNGLEGWERARWLRHMVAKLRGSSDVDPPRPAASGPAAGHAFNVDDPVASTAEVSVVPPDGAVVERPLSPEEIETMTADFVAEQEIVPVSVAQTRDRPAATGTATDASPPSLDAVDMGFLADSASPYTTFAEPAAVAVASPETDATQVASPDAEFGSDDALDVDTEALSAMIDARLAEPESQAPSDSPEVWRVVSGGAVTPLQSGAPPETGAILAGMLPVDRPVGSPAAVPTAKVQDDSDVLASLPSLDDWQLVDPEASAVVADKPERKAPEPTLPESFAGLELVPMETIRPVAVRAEPIERWMGGSQPAKPEAESVNVNRSSAVGGKS